MEYTEEQFFEKIKPFVIADMKRSNILASLTAAQARLESRTGNSLLTQKANNLFGIKGSYNGQSVNMLTTEIVNGTAIKIHADFRKYDSWLASINDHSNFLLKYKRYASIIGEKNYINACKKMAHSGYATAKPEEYFASLVSIIKRNKLYEWDGVEIDNEDIYIKGHTYVLNTNLYIRSEPFGTKMKYECITQDAKTKSHFDEYGCAILEKGSRVTCIDVKDCTNSVWLLIPSGWICAEEEGKVYIE